MTDRAHIPGLKRRTLVQAAIAAPAVLALPSLARAQAAPVRVGYAIARTGPWTTGAQVSQEPNYLLWAEQQNAAGGLNVKGTQASHRARSAATTRATSKPACAPTKS